jgi:Ethanolamine utilization protein EutJ (predicted chaperonin)
MELNAAASAGRCNPGSEGDRAREKINRLYFDGVAILDACDVSTSFTTVLDLDTGGPRDGLTLNLQVGIQGSH